MTAGGLDSGLHSKTAVLPLRTYTGGGETGNLGATKRKKKAKTS